MSSLELFQHPNFKGEHTSLKCDNPDLRTVGFLQKAQSLKVQGDPWIVFSCTGYYYNADFKIFTEGEYPSIPSWANRICSARIIRGGLYPRKITLYEHVYYEGRAVTVENPVSSLKSYGFEDTVSSHKNVSGAWILYSEDNFKGDKMVTVAGEDLPNYHPRGWGDIVRSLKPITADMVHENF